MSRISQAFFAAAVLYALGGMGLGMFMSATQDFTMRPLHAHINLLGWAGLALMGAFYGVAREHAPGKLGWTVFAIANLGNILLLSQLYNIVHGRPPIVPLLMAGEFSVLGSMLLFGVSVLLSGRKPAAG